MHPVLNVYLANSITTEQRRAAARRRLGRRTPGRRAR